MIIGNEEDKQFLIEEDPVIIDYILIGIGELPKEEFQCSKRRIEYCQKIGHNEYLLEAKRLEVRNKWCYLVDYTS